MTSQQIFYCLPEIFEKMKPVRTLRGLWSTLRSRRGIRPSTISAHDHQIELLAHPSG